MAPETGRKVSPSSLVSAGAVMSPATATFSPFFTQWLRAKLRRSAAVMEEMLPISPLTGWA